MTTHSLLYEVDMINRQSNREHQIYPKHKMLINYNISKLLLFSGMSEDPQILPCLQRTHTENLQCLHLTLA